jgi:hypothetical protein
MDACRRFRVDQSLAGRRIAESVGQGFDRSAARGPSPTATETDELVSVLQMLNRGLCAVDSSDQRASMPPELRKLE